MIEAAKDFPLYNDENVLIYYKIGDPVDVNKALSEKLILSGKCRLHDPREKKESVENKIVDDYEKKIDPPAKKRKKRKS